MRDDQPGFRVAVDNAGEVVCDRRQPAPSMNQDRDVALGCELEDRREPLVVQQELLCPGMKLGLADRVFCEVEPDERNHPPSRSLGERQRAVVAGAEPRMPVRLVQTEHEAAGDAVLGHPAFQVLVDADHPVDVGAEVRVRVENVRTPRQLSAKLLVPLRHQDLGTLQRVVHALESMQRPLACA